MSSFQNLMMLAALLPSLSNTYMRILDMIDVEAAKAEAERRKIIIDLEAYGGVWGPLTDAAVTCGLATMFAPPGLEPDKWRLTVRAMLKLDVYGINDKTPGVRPEMACQLAMPGLIDIIGMLEQRSLARHKQLDYMIASGAIGTSDLCGEYVALSSEVDKPACLRIIDVARRCMHDLVIP
jgi:hypothetical protein